MPDKRYRYTNAADPNQTYELVQLLRLNGMAVTRRPDGVAIRMGHKGMWRTQVLTNAELRKRFGPGTTEYRLLTAHPRANNIVRAYRRSLLESLA